MMPHVTTAKPRPTKPARGTCTPETWVEAATEVLVDQGIDRVRVDVLAQELGMTRGSFYWHFKDREELLRRVLQAWRNSATEALTQRLERAHTDPREQLQDLVSLPWRGRAAVRAARIELAIRAWGRRDEMAAQVVREADESRLGYIAQVFSALGFGVMDARRRAFILYSSLLGDSLLGELSEHAAVAQRRARLELIEGLFTATLGCADERTPEHASAVA
ncbi:MAG: TetR/AcrR family transcriptional regulator [Betaproteobacteria bacterium]